MIKCRGYINVILAYFNYSHELLLLLLLLLRLLWKSDFVIATVVNIVESMSMQFSRYFNDKIMQLLASLHKLMLGKKTRVPVYLGMFHHR